MVRQHSDRFVLCRYTGLAPWAVYSAMQIGEWLKCIAGAVMVKKGVWLENLTGKGKMKISSAGK